MYNIERQSYAQSKHELITEAATAVQVTFRGLASFLLTSAAVMKVGGIDASLQTEALLVAGSAVTGAASVPFGRMALRHAQHSENIQADIQTVLQEYAPAG
jgi:hypothetical protein